MIKIVQSPGANPPAFIVPPGVSAIEHYRLEESKLIKFYELNRDDFYAVVTVVYSVARNAKDAGAVLQPGQGFKSFCELLTQFLMAAPGESELWSKDENGRNVNLFGKAFMQHLSGRALQDLYAYDGPVKHEKEWHYVYALVGFVAIDAFRHGVRVDDDGIAAARERISQLIAGDRVLHEVIKPVYGKR